MLGGSAEPIFAWALRWTTTMSDQGFARRLRGLMRAALSDAVLGIDGGHDVEADIYLTEAAAILGVDRGGLYEVVNALAGGKSERRRKLVLTQSQVDLLAVHIRDLMTRQEAASALGLPSWELSHLEKAGHLFPILRINGGEARGARFLRRDVDTILSKIAALPAARDGGVSVLTHARKAGMSQGHVAVAVLEGSVVGKQVEGNHAGFRAVRVAAIGTYAYQKTALTSGKALSATDVMAITNLEHRAVSKLATSGWFGPETKQANLRTFERHAVEAFASLYRPIIEFAAPMGLSVDDVADRLRKAGVECLEDGPRWSHAVRRSDAIQALGMPFDPTAIKDAEFDAFWADLLKLAASDAPHYRFPPRLPAAGQLVWRSNRKVSVFLRFDAQTRSLRLELNTGGSDGTHRKHVYVRISDGPRAAMTFFSGLNGDVRRARSPPSSADIAKPTTAISHDEVSR